MIKDNTRARLHMATELVEYLSRHELSQPKIVDVLEIIAEYVDLTDSEYTQMICEKHFNGLAPTIENGDE